MWPKVIEMPPLLYPQSERIAKGAGFRGFSSVAFGALLVAIVDATGYA